MPTTLWQRRSRQQPPLTSAIPTLWKLVSRRQYPRSDRAVELIQPAAAPLDEGATATARLPASGWWRCVEARALDGTRWFGRGQSLPMATVRQQLSMLEQLKGTREATHHNVIWQFIRHDGGAKITPAEHAATDDSADKPA
ncbi:MAG: hypothetical protein QFF03_21240 [Pseudomonadota bacterium]|nr:hypothetical protein [Pseudomonadota bacterium]